MKFLTYRHNDKIELGVIHNEMWVIPLKEIYRSIGETVPTDMNALVDSLRPNDVPLFQKLLLEMEIKIPLEEVDILAPIQNPRRSVICLGKNYLDHALETMGLPGGTETIPEYPIYFTKVASPAVGHKTTVSAHTALTDSVDYEVELAIIIGKDGVNISKEDAASYIFGYTIINDLSARDLQRNHGQWFKGKSLDTFCPMGPYILHASAVEFPIEMNISCSVNGELRQNSNTKHLIFDIPTIIADLSKGMGLKKGDIISTGTPAGVGLGFTPPKYLKVGDVVSCTIEGIGTLENIVGE